MQVNITTAINSLKAASDSWDKVAPSLQTLQNGLNAVDISQAFEKVTALLDIVQDADVDALAWAAYKGTFDSAPQQLQNTIVPHVGNVAHITGQAQNICSFLWSLKTAALALIPIHPESERASPHFAQELSARIEVMQRQLAEIEKLRDDARTASASTFNVLTEATGKNSDMDKIVASANKQISEIEAHEREAATSRTNALSSAASAETDAKKASSLRSELEESILKKEELFKEFNDRRDEITGLLESANKVGLARSFQEKRKSLTYTWIFWAILFICAISGLVVISFLEILPFIKSGSPTPMAVAGRLMIVSPLVWLAWFAARQYGHTLRISEDYSFKEAAAMAFAGYRNEVASDDEMLKLLRASAIRTFGSNPTDLLLKHPDATSPLNEALDKALEKLDASQIIDAVAKLLGSIQKSGK